MTGNEGLVQACGDTLAHAHMSNVEQKDILFRVWCLRVGGGVFFFFSLFLSGACRCVRCHGACVWLARFAAAGSSPNWESDVGKL